MSLPPAMLRERTHKAMQTLWLLGSGVVWALGCRYLLDLRQVQADHRERMAEISTERARLDDEIEQRRADRARPDQADQAAGSGEIGDTCRIISWPTRDERNEWREDPAVTAPGESTGRHAMVTRRVVGNT